MHDGSDGYETGWEELQPEEAEDVCSHCGYEMTRQEFLSGTCPNCFENPDEEPF